VKVGRVGLAEVFPQHLLLRGDHHAVDVAEERGEEHSWPRGVKQHARRGVAVRDAFVKAYSETSFSLHRFKG
jgi:hypothetical protein